MFQRGSRFHIKSELLSFLLWIEPWFDLQSLQKVLIESKKPKQAHLKPAENDCGQKLSQWNVISVLWLSLLLCGQWVDDWMCSQSISLSVRLCSLKAIKRSTSIIWCVCLRVCGSVSHTHTHTHTQMSQSGTALLIIIIGKEKKRKKNRKD